MKRALCWACRAGQSVCKAGRRPPRVTQDGTHEFITVIDTVCAAQFVLPLMIICKGATHYRGGAVISLRLRYSTYITDYKPNYRGWYIELETKGNADAIFAYVSHMEARHPLEARRYYVINKTSNACTKLNPKQQKNQKISLAQCFSYGN